MAAPDSGPAFETWLVSVLPDRMPADVRAFCFNISQTIDSFVVEVIGSSLYDPADGDWACEETWTCRPAKSELPFASVGNEWERVLDLVVQLVSSVLHTSTAPRIESLRKAEAVAVGFVDGDLARVWP